MTIMHQIGEASRSLSLDSAAVDFTRYVKTTAIRDWWYRRHGLMLDELQIATAHSAASSRLQAMLKMRPETMGDVTKKIMDNVAVGLPGGLQQKTAVGVGSIDGGTWGDALAPYQQASAAFLASLAPFSAFDRLLNDNAFTRLPLRTRVAIASDAAIGSTVEEGQPKPVSAMSFGYVLLPAYKAIGQVVVTNETVLAVSPAANKLFESEMQKAVAKVSDVKFLEIVTESTGITSNPSTGLNNPTQFLADLETAIGAIEVGAGSKLYLILPASAFKTVLQLRDQGGSLVVNNKIGAITVIATSADTADGILLDATAVAADTDIVATRVSDQSDVIMQDNPTAGSHQHISLFQNNLTLIRCERFFGAAVLRSDGIAVISDMV